MWFDKENKVIIETLNKVEAKAFIDFLQEEEERHIDCVYDALGKVREESNNEYWGARNKFWESEIARHKDDVSDIKALIEKVRELFE